MVRLERVSDYIEVSDYRARFHCHSSANLLQTSAVHSQSKWDFGLLRFQLMLVKSSWAHSLYRWLDHDLLEDYMQGTMALAVVSDYRGGWIIDVAVHTSL